MTRAGRDPAEAGAIPVRHPERRPRGRGDRHRSPKPGIRRFDSCRGRRDSSSRVMRLASQLHCLWSEAGSIPVHATAHGMQSHGDQGASKTPREGSIPSHPAKWGRSEVSFCTRRASRSPTGDNAGLGVRPHAAPPLPGAIVQQENPAIAMRRSGCDSPSLHHLATRTVRGRSGAIAQPGERLDGIEEVAGAIPAGSTHDHEHLECS